MIHDEEHRHYQQFREEHGRQLDEEYAAWRRERDGAGFERWRSGRQESIAPAHESPAQSLGRAISETVTGSRDPDPARLPDTAEAGTGRESSQRFFERG